MPAAVVTAASSRVAGSLRRWRVLALLALLFALWFGFLELRGLFVPDEGRYAEIPREMLASGDWITPRLDGIAYFEKPPLQYWITAAIFAVTVEDEWSARLWPAIAGLLAVLCVAGTARRLYSRRAAWMAASFMGSSIGFFLATQFLTLDMGLTALLTAALCAFVLAQDARASPRTRRRFMLAAWLACALAVLAKGLIGLVLPALAVATYVAVARDAGLLRRLHWAPGILLMFAVTLPWFVAVELRNPGFSQFFFIHEHWQRFTSPAHRRPGPWWYFVPIALVALLPWLPALFAYGRAPRALQADAPAKAFDVRVFLWCWTGAIFVFFSLSSSKLPAYILPAMGALALAVAPALVRQWRAVLRLDAWTAVALGLALLAGAPAAARWIKVAQVRDAYAQNVGWLLGAGAVLVVAGIAVLFLLHARRRIAALGMLVVGVILACQVGVVMLYQIDAYFSGERLIERLTEDRPPFRPDVPFYSVDMLDATVPFYLGRTVILVHEPGELAWGIAMQPERFVPDLDAFARRWRSETEAFAIMGAAAYSSLRASGLPMRLVDDDGRRFIVSRQ